MDSPSVLHPKLPVRNTDLLLAIFFGAMIYLADEPAQRLPLIGLGVGGGCGGGGRGAALTAAFRRLVEPRFGPGGLARSRHPRAVDGVHRGARQYAWQGNPDRIRALQSHRRTTR